MAYTIDNNGWLHSPKTRIARVGVYEYYGRELNLPNADPNRVYRVYRPQEVLIAAVDAFPSGGVPFIDEHAMLGEMSGLNAEDYGVGGTLSSVWFEYPYLYGDVKVFDQDVVAGIESKKKVELSLGYWGAVKLESGVTPWGAPYDVIVTKTEPNHLAIVGEGRTGADVAFMDSKAKAGIMDAKFTIEENSIMDIQELIAAVKAAVEGMTPEQKGEFVASLGILDSASTDDDTNKKGVTDENPDGDLEAKAKADAAEAAAKAEEAAEDLVEAAELAADAVVSGDAQTLDDAAEKLAEAEVAVEEAADAAEAALMDGKSVKALKGRLSRVQKLKGMMDSAGYQRGANKAMASRIQALSAQVRQLKTANTGGMMDSAAVIKSIADRQRVIEQVTPHIGTFNADAMGMMDAASVAKYALNKMGVEPAPAGAEVYAVGLAVAARVADSAKPTSRSTAFTDSKSVKSDSAKDRFQ